ncbi:50S ribosomal protein L17 [bacterium]|nr:50S ribosomal protein L17 [bacterium]
MRHRNAIKKLGRTTTHRKATMANLSTALFERKHVRTTVAKAKAVRSYSEKLITLAKKETLHARRLALRKLGQKQIVKILFEEIAPNYSDRPGGYTRIIKLGQRAGDGAEMAIIELVGYEMASKKKKEKEKEKEAKAEPKKKKRAKAESVEKEPIEKKKKKGKKDGSQEQSDDHALKKAKQSNKEEKKDKSPKKGKKQK